jgi:hypothetical protein
MGKANQFGPSSGSEGANALFNAQLVDFDEDASPVYSEIMPLEHYDGLSVQLVSGGARSIEVLAGDSVDASSQIWFFKDGQFTENDVGATFTIAGSAEGNDGSFTIDSVTDSSHVVSVETPTADEDFDPDAVTVDLVQTSVLGSWSFRVSNSYSPGFATNTVNDGEPWTPINSQFTPPIATVAAQFIKGTANSANQYNQAYPLCCSAVQLRFTPTSGRGPITAWVEAKGNR